MSQGVLASVFLEATDTYDPGLFSMVDELGLSATIIATGLMIWAAPLRVLEADMFEARPRM